jgi:hypothetical protein
MRNEYKLTYNEISKKTGVDKSQVRQNIIDFIKKIKRMRARLYHLGRPRKYNEETLAKIMTLRNKGFTCKGISKLLKIPLESIDNILYRDKVREKVLRYRARHIDKVRLWNKEYSKNYYKKKRHAKNKL